MKTYWLKSLEAASLRTPTALLETLESLPPQREGLALCVGALGEVGDWLRSAVRHAESADGAGAEAEVQAVRRQALEFGRAVLPPADQADFTAALEDALAAIRDRIRGVERAGACLPLTLAEILGVGERVTASLVAQALSLRGTPSRAVEARTLLERDRRAASGLDVDATGRKVRAAAERWSQVTPVIGGFAEVGVSREAAVSLLRRVLEGNVSERSRPVREVGASLFLVGRGTVGSELLRQVKASVERSTRPLRVVGIADLSGVLFEPRGLDLDRLPPRPATPSDVSPPDLKPWLEALAALPRPVLVDCTAAEGMDRVYREAFHRRVSVVAANKRPLTASSERRAELFEAARANRAGFRYASTVGAGLPILETLQSMVDTGDTIRLVEGCFSGTLNHVGEALFRGTPFSAAVREARALHLTEPHPGDDLSGADVARKTLILARELGLALELSDVVMEPLVPASTLAMVEAEQLLSALSAHDAPLAERVAHARARGVSLRYLSRIDLTQGTAWVSVGFVDVSLDHPATQVRGAEAWARFVTDRYGDHPLSIRGAGAGASVTAAGLMGDVLRLTADTYRPFGRVFTR